MDEIIYYNNRRDLRFFNDSWKVLKLHKGSKVGYVVHVQ